MGDYFVFTAIGTDRVGIVDEIAAVLEAENCNIEESRTAVLGTEFSVMLLASGGQGIVQILEKDLPDIGDKLGLHVQIRPTRAPRGSSEGRPYSIEAISLDAPGIMHAVTAVLKRAGAKTSFPARVCLKVSSCTSVHNSKPAFSIPFKTFSLKLNSVNFIIIFLPSILN